MGYKDIKKPKPHIYKTLFGTKSSMGDPGTNWNQLTEQGPTVDTLNFGFMFH